MNWMRQFGGVISTVGVAKGLCVCLQSCTPTFTKSCIRPLEHKNFLDWTPLSFWLSRCNACAQPLSYSSRLSKFDQYSTIDGCFNNAQWLFVHMCTDKWDKQTDVQTNFCWTNKCGTRSGFPIIVIGDDIGFKSTALASLYTVCRYYSHSACLILSLSNRVLYSLYNIETLGVAWGQG